MNTLNEAVPSMISEMADAVGGTINECVNNLGDGSGFATMSMPLPEDHWLYEKDANGWAPPPPYTLLAGKATLTRRYLEDQVQPAIRYGVKAATMDGREDDFDPDALVRNALNGLFGLHTATGLSGDPEDSRLFDPEKPGSLKDVLLEAISLALHDGLMSMSDVGWAISSQGVSEAVERHTERERIKEEEYQALRIRKGWDKLETQEEPTDAPPFTGDTQDIG
jgi:hypothetical protein